MGVNQSLPFFLSVFFLFLQPAIQPLEVGALPENTVLGFQYPVVLVGEYQQLGLNTTALKALIPWVALMR